MASTYVAMLAKENSITQFSDSFVSHTISTTLTQYQNLKIPLKVGIRIVSIIVAADREQYFSHTR